MKKNSNQIDLFSADNKSANDTIFAENGVTKTYEIDELVTKVIFTAADKATKQEDLGMYSGKNKQGFSTMKYKPTGNIQTLGIV